MIQEESGQHFDPEVVKAFLEIFDVIKLIRAKYTDALPEEIGRASCRERV